MYVGSGSSGKREMHRELLCILVLSPLPCLLLRSRLRRMSRKERETRWSGGGRDRMGDV